MEDLIHYFQKEFVDDKKRIERIDTLVNNAISSLTYFHKGQLAYTIENSLDDAGNDPSAEVDPQNISISTHSMNLVVLLKILNNIELDSPLIPQIEWPRLIDVKKKEKDLVNRIKSIFNRIGESIQHFLALENTSIPAGSKWVCHSSSFGENDPLTLSWLIEISESKMGNLIPDLMKKEIESVCKWRCETNLTNLETPILLFSKDDVNKSLQHIFPLIRIIHIYKTLQRKKEKNPLWPDFPTISSAHLDQLQQNLLNRIYQQLSYSIVSPNLFDTSELVMSLEGVLLLEDKVQVVNADLVKKVFEVIFKHQDYNLSWRPLKPFVISPRGQVLLPLSIEIANSLLRIDKLLQAKGKFYFYNYFGMFRKYFEWLDSEQVRVMRGDTRYYGWRSEHVSQSGIIHPWETAQVVLFLMNYRSLLQDQVAYWTLTKSGLSVKPGAGDVIERFNEKLSVDLTNGSSVPSLDDVIDITPLEAFLQKEPLKNFSLEPYLIYKNITDEFLRPRNRSGESFQPDESKRNFSMLLYGPPGTGKTGIALGIAGLLGYPMITITPSDFLLGGGSFIETNAKNIFKVLGEQKKSVILLDEIDRLLLDRDSSHYARQDEVFKFMTPSMLVKIKDLRDKQQCIFIISTNYAELIDPAIMRPGRIDKRYLVNPPNLAQRKQILIDRIQKKSSILLASTNATLSALAHNSVLCTFTELTQLIDDCQLNTDMNSQAIEAAIEKIPNPHPMINLTSYKRRFQDENQKLKPSPQCPIAEFLMLAYLKAESLKKLTSEERNTFNIALDILNAADNAEPKASFKEYFDSSDIIDKLMKHVNNEIT